MDVSEKEIVVEFERQVRLCSDIGRAAQERIVEAFWAGKNPSSTKERLAEPLRQLSARLRQEFLAEEG